MKKFTVTAEEATILLGVAQQPPAGQNGYTIEDVRSALKTMDAVEAVKDGGIVKLEDGYHAWLVSRLDRQPWAMASAIIVKLVDKVKGASA